MRYLFRRHPGSKNGNLGLHVQKHACLYGMLRKLLQEQVDSRVLRVQANRHEAGLQPHRRTDAQHSKMEP